MAKTYVIGDLDSAGRTTLAAIIAETGYTTDDSVWSRIDGKIETSLEFETYLGFGRKRKAWKGVKLQFSHAGNNDRKSWRMVAAKDGALDLDKLKAKIEEMMEFYAKYDRQLAAQNEKQQAIAQKNKAVKAQCDEVGVEIDCLRSYNGIKARASIDRNGGVQLECYGLTPRQVKKIIALLEAGE